jgi:hypothetical protein
MKKLIILLTLLFVVVGLIGCGNNACDCDTDLSPIIARLSAVEAELATLQGGTNPISYQPQINNLLQEVARLEGLISGLTTSNNTITNIQTALESLRNDLTALQNQVSNLPDSSINRIYQLGETFTFINHGLELFSLRLETSDVALAGFSVWVTNINLPGYAPNDFLRVRAQNNDVWMTQGFSTTILNIGGLAGLTINNSFTGNYLWFGFPTQGTSSMIPFVIFSTS